jgi:ABC-type enterochelin transport system substrate-binding protein
MRIVITMQKSHFIAAVALLALLSAVIVLAAVDKTRAWHSGDAVEVSVNGTVKSLQQALDDGTMPAGFAREADHAALADYSDDANSVNGFRAEDFP